MMVKKSKRRRQLQRQWQKSKSKKDQISNLPDCLIQLILSFLPSTKEAIRTSVLSKQWKNQWTVVPVLTINSHDGKYFKNILKFYNCLKIKKFHFEYDTACSKNLRFNEIVSFATNRRVEDLTLICPRFGPKSVLPESFFNNASLVKLRAESCLLVPKGMLNWAHLKSLILRDCTLWSQAMEHISAGSPLLEYFKIIYCGGFDNKLAITSTSLKILLLHGVHLRVFEISCPNLKELSLWYSSLIDQPKLAIASESLKRLHIGFVSGIHCLQVSCTKLERLELYGYMEFDKVELMNLPSSVDVALEFTCKKESSNKEIYQRLAEDILHQIHHVNKLKLGMWLIEVLSGLEANYLFSPVLNAKCLRLYDPGEKYHSGIACVLRSLPMLKTLVIIEDCCKEYDFVEPTDFQEKYPDSTVFNFQASHLKNVVIIGSPVFLSSSRWSLPAIGINDTETRMEKAIQEETRIEKSQ